MTTLNTVYMDAETLCKRVGFSLVEVLCTPDGIYDTIVIGRRTIDNSTRTEFAVWRWLPEERGGLTCGHYFEDIERAVGDATKRSQYPLYRQEV